MLTRDDACALVMAELQKLQVASTPELVLVKDRTIERDWGWVFFYTSARYVQTRDIRDALAGNAPYLVNRHTGEVRVTGTARPIEHYIAEYEREVSQPPRHLLDSQLIASLLRDLSTKLGYSMAGRDPYRFEQLAALGPDVFADAVLAAEGISAELDKHARRQVRAFVGEPFASWNSEGAA
jgi:hypothetical protein